MSSDSSQCRTGKSHSEIEHMYEWKLLNTYSANKFKWPIACRTTLIRMYTLRIGMDYSFTRVKGVNYDRRMFIQLGFTNMYYHE